MRAKVDLLSRINDLRKEQDMLDAFPGGIHHAETDIKDDDATEAEGGFARYATYRALPSGDEDALNTGKRRVAPVTLRLQVWAPTDVAAAEGIELLERKFKPLGHLQRNSRVLSVERSNDDLFPEDDENEDAEEVWQGVIELSYRVEYDAWP